ncbi:DUF397 domain-containing protein [Actinomadura fulvescens]|uniref:DUF397 domain-containing protein n=1 Tax=Actinomadura fulvescens TaxID=46160 RepID=A0ABP6CHU6_9ACTN
MQNIKAADNGLCWFKSTYSGASGNGACVETAMTGSGMAMRHSKDPGGTVLRFDSLPWKAFLGEIKEGVHDLT